MYKIFRKIKKMLGGSYCHKTEMGYTCRHRIMSNGKKECN